MEKIKTIPVNKTCLVTETNPTPSKDWTVGITISAKDKIVSQNKITKFGNKLKPVSFVQFVISANSEQSCCENFDFTHNLPVNQPLFVDSIDLFLIKTCNNLILGSYLIPFCLQDLLEENCLVAKVHCGDNTYEIKFYNAHNGSYSHLITVETDLNNKANYFYEQFDI